MKPTKRGTKVEKLVNKLEERVEARRGLGLPVDTTVPESTVDFLLRLRETAPKDVVKLQLGSRYGLESKYVTAEFDQRQFPDGIELVHITDVQFGHKKCRVDRFVEYRDWILSAPNRFVLFGGDMVDAATAISVASPYENTVEPQGQVWEFVKLAMPMRHRVLSYVGGNHERRSVKTFGDLGPLIATLLGVPYSSGLQFVDVVYGKHRPFRNALHHGSGASQTSGAKMMMLERFAKRYPGSDLYWVGHLHDCFCKYWTAVDRADGEITTRKYAGVMSSSFLEFFGTYAEVMGLEANDLHMWKVVLERSGKWHLTIR